MANPHIFEIRRLVERSEELAAAGDLDAARKALRDALRLDPDNIELLCALGRLDLERGDLTAARKGYERSLAIDSRHLQARYELAFLRIEERRFEEAEVLLAGLVQELPDSVEALAELGYLYRSTGRLRRALETYRRALEISPDAPEVLLAYAVALCDWGETDEAQACLERASAGLPDDPADETRRTVDRLLTELEFDDEGGIKRELFHRYGAVVLGTPSDDGLDVPAYFFYHLEAEETATMLGRLLAVARALDWPLEAVAAVDPDGAPAGRALASNWGVPFLDDPGAMADAEDGEAPGAVLLVEAVGDGEGAERHWAEAKVREHGRTPITLTLVLVSGGQTLDDCPDIIGVSVPAEGSVPWGREGSGEDPTDDLIRRLDEALPEDNVAEQVRFYAIDHRTIRPHLRAPRGPVLDLGPLLRTLPAREEALAGLASEDPTAIAGALSRLERSTELTQAEIEAVLDLFRRRSGARTRADQLLSSHAPDLYAGLLISMAERPRGVADRREAVSRLLGLDRPDVLDFLAASLADGDDDLRYWIVGPGGWGALELLESDPRFPELVRRCLFGGGRAAVAAVSWLRLRGDARFVDEARELLQAGDEDLKVQALAYLAGVDAQVPWRAVRRFLWHPEDEVVRAVCRALEVHWSPLVGRRLAHLVRTGSPAIAGEALAALLRHQEGRGRRSLRWRIRRSGDRADVLAALADAVARAGGPQTATVLATLVDGRPLDDEVRTPLLAALAAAGDHRVLGAVRGLLALTDDPPLIAFDYVESYGDADDEAALASLLGGGVTVQCRAAAALCRVGRLDFLEVLRDSLDCRNQDRFRAACEAIARVDGPVATRMILDQLDRPDCSDGVLAAMETWVMRRTIAGRLSALESGARQRLGDFLSEAFEGGLPDQRRRALEMMEAVGEQRGAPTVEGWMSLETDAELALTALEHIVRRPTPSRAAAARRLMQHEAPEVRTLAAAVVAHWDVGGPGLGGG